MPAATKHIGDGESLKNMHVRFVEIRMIKISKEEAVDRKTGYVVLLHH